MPKAVVSARRPYHGLSPTARAVQRTGTHAATRPFWEPDTTIRLLNPGQDVVGAAARIHAERAFAGVAEMFKSSRLLAQSPAWAAITKSAARSLGLEKVGQSALRVTAGESLVKTPMLMQMRQLATVASAAPGMESARQAMVDNVAGIAALNGIGSDVLRSAFAPDFIGRSALSSISVAMPTLQNMGLLDLVEQTIGSLGIGSTIMLPASLVLADSPAWARVVGNDVFPDTAGAFCDAAGATGTTVEEAFAEIDESSVENFLRCNPELVLRHQAVEQIVFSTPIDRIQLSAAYCRFRSSAVARFLVLTVVLPVAAGAIDQLLTDEQRQHLLTYLTLLQTYLAFR